MKNTLKAIIKYLAGNEFYFCYRDGELFTTDEPCYCLEHYIQEAHDAIYVAFAGLFGGYRIDTKQALTEEFNEEILELAQQKADEEHLNFWNTTLREAAQAIEESKELKQILFERFTETAHK